MNKLVLLLVCLVLLAVAIEAKKHNSPKSGSPKRAPHHGKQHGKQHHGGRRAPNPKPHGPKRPHMETPAPVESSIGSGGDFGDRLLRSFLIFKNQPLTVDDAENQGFTEFTNGCTQFGHGYSKGYGPTKSDSAIVYFTEGGQLAGFGSRMWGDAPAALIEQGYWMETDAADGSYDLVLQTRDASMICSGATDSNVLGDRLWINGIMEIPLAMSTAQAAGWVEGNCIPKMGIHHAFDLNYPFSQSWNASSLVPVMPMYSPQTGAITAVLLASTDAQRIEPLFGDWEGPFINMLFCKNWCANTGCTFPGVSLWTTMHWLFEDPKDNVCDGAKCVI